MSSIVTKLEDIDFKLSAVTIFCPDGDVISINKLDNMSLHAEYLYAMAQSNEKIKGLFKGIDFKYYLKNPVAIIIELMPLLTSKGLSIYNNLSPDTMEPTKEGIMFLPEPSHMTDYMKENMMMLHDKLSEIKFQDIGFYDSSTNFFKPCDTENRLEHLFSVITEDEKDLLEEQVKINKLVK